MKRRTVAVLAVTATTALAVSAAPGATAAGGDGKTVLNNSGKVSDRGLRLGTAAPSTTGMSLTLQLPLRNQALANSMIARGQVISTAQYRKLFAPTSAQMSKVTSWAKGQGLTVTSASPNSGQVMVKGQIAKVNKAFGVSMKRASLNGVNGLSPDKAPTVPASLGITGVAGLNTLHRMTPKHVSLPDALKRGGASSAGPSSKLPHGAVTGLPSANASDGNMNCADYWGGHLYPTALKYKQQSNYICGYLPADLTTMYGVKAAQAKAPTIGILLWADDPAMQSLTNTYMAATGYPLMTNYKAYVDPPNAQMADCDPKGVVVEQSLDVQSSHAIAPNSPIRYYGAASCYDNALTTSLQKMIDTHEVSTISMSFGGTTDAGLTAADKAAWDRPFQQAALTGISVFASSGDDGDNSKREADGKPHVGPPATSSYITAVGATSVGMTASGAQPALSAWENTYYLQGGGPATPGWTLSTQYYDGGGGGISESYAMPVWQKGKVNGYSSTMRVVPDVSAVGNPYTAYTVRANFYDPDTGVTTTGYEAIGGTSLSSPVTAAVVALAKAYNNVKIGNAAPKFYALAGTAAIKDVNARGVVGTNYVNASGQLKVVGFDDKPLSLVSSPGWDNATGVGTMNGWSFITSFK